MSAVNNSFKFWTVTGTTLSVMVLAGTLSDIRLQSTSFMDSDQVANERFDTLNYSLNNISDKRKRFEFLLDCNDGNVKDLKGKWSVVEITDGFRNPIHDVSSADVNLELVCDGSDVGMINIKDAGMYNLFTPDEESDADVDYDSRLYLNLGSGNEMRLVSELRDGSHQVLRLIKITERPATDLGFENNKNAVASSSPDSRTGSFPYEMNDDFYYDSEVPVKTNVSGVMFYKNIENRPLIATKIENPLKKGTKDSDEYTMSEPVIRFEDSDNGSKRVVIDNFKVSMNGEEIVNGDSIVVGQGGQFDLDNGYTAFITNDGGPEKYSIRLVSSSGNNGGVIISIGTNEQIKHDEMVTENRGKILEDGGVNHSGESDNQGLPTDMVVANFSESNEDGVIVDSEASEVHGFAKEEALKRYQDVVKEIEAGDTVNDEYKMASVDMMGFDQAEDGADIKNDGDNSGVSQNVAKAQTEEDTAIRGLANLEIKKTIEDNGGYSF